MGLKQQFLPPHHPWFSYSTWNTVGPTIAELCATGGDGYQPLSSDAIVLLPLRRVGQEWQVPCPNHGQEIKVFLASHKHDNWLLQIDEIDVPYLDQLVEQTRETKQNSSLGIYAKAQRVARHLRKAAPQWVYAADASTLMKFHVMSQLGLETVADFWPDFVLFQTQKGQAATLSEREAQELQRRHKRLIWNRVSQQDPQPTFTPEGILTTDLP